MQATGAIDLQLPQQELNDTRFAPAEPTAVQQWLDQRHRTNIGQFTRDLYQALSELNRCRLQPDVRLEVLEVLRPAVHAACRTLDRHLRDQPVVLPARTRQIYQLAQTLENQLTVGYRIVAGEAPPRRKRFLRSDGNEGQECALAIHRAITEKTHMLLRSCRLYLDVRPGFWLDLHQLYRYATSLHLQEREISDTEAAQVYPLSLEQTYLKALLVGCIHSRGLRPEDLQTVAELLNEWLPLASLAPYRIAEDDCLAVNLLGDRPPVYNALFKPPADIGSCRLLGVNELLTHLRGLLATPTPVPRPQPLTEDLIKHLLFAWGAFSRRAFMRIESSDHLALCVGMSNLHYFACGEIEFKHWLDGKNHRSVFADDATNPFLRPVSRHRDHDIWDDVDRPRVSTTTISLDSIDTEIRHHRDRHPEACADTSTHSDHQLQMVNISSGGYCLQWPAEITATLQAGELVGVRETRHASWSAGIVRWVHRDGEAAISSIGVELLSPRVIPFGARITNRAETAGEEYRVLLLPERAPVGQAATLVTPALPFREKQKLELLQPGRVVTVQLTRRVATTGSVNLFEYEVIRDSVALADDAAQNFEELWQSL